ncbi:MAG: DNA starvation/stationary phase protection protein [Zavarzinia sp.]|nr:DNA starvation/stationary phase protection protein [Zavarzinia sp.]
MAKTNEPAIDIGLDDAAREKAAGILSTVLADTFTAYLKVHNYHWNVTGPQFRQLHSVFDEQYTELHDSVDEIAERIRVLGYKAPGSLAAFAKLTSIGEAAEGATPDEMVRDVLATHETLVRNFRKAESELGDLGDTASADMVVGRIAASEKAAWMLRASLA